MKKLLPLLCLLLSGCAVQPEMRAFFPRDNTPAIDTTLVLGLSVLTEFVVIVLPYLLWDAHRKRRGIR